MNPKTVGVILDGNRRWAKGKGLLAFAGHSKGYEVFKDFLSWAQDAGVTTVMAYVFSEENWKRSEDEVSFLISLMYSVVERDANEMISKNIRLRFAGDIARFPQDLALKMRALEEKSKHNSFTVMLCVSYTGKSEILHAVNTALSEKKEKGESDATITEADIASHVYTTGLPDPDMIIRTSGEMRLSGFLLWQCAYAELFFTKTLWPDFSKEEFLGMIEEYSKRERRIGK